ncbi:hypothetical protein N9X64_00420 [bacterium]|nr:hypothetical protein [bacterium]
MQMQSVPTSLIGASLGEAHKWVRSQMVLSNPHKPMADYTLTNESGKSVNLSDLTKGNASHVTIISGAGGVRNNPAHPAELTGFMEVPKPMHASRLTALTQNDITPALYHSMVNEYGLFNAVQTLSILLTRPVSPSLRHTPKTANMIRARKGQSLLPLHKFIPTKPESRRERSDQGSSNRNRNRSNSRSNPSSGETRTAATALGFGNQVPLAARQMGRAGALGLKLDRTTNDIRREVDRMLDDTEDAFNKDEHGALISVANQMSMKYENSRDLFENFSKQVLAPYLITSTANVNSLKYINEYILPAMREVILDGKGSKDKKLRKLDRQYRHIVKKLATDPRDFYMGSEFALVAHPGFLFPRAGLALMPVPTSTRDKAFRTFEQAGTPPTYDPTTGFVATMGKSDNTGVAYINQETIERLGRQTFASSRMTTGISRVIDNLVDVIERYGETDSTGFNVLVQDTRSMTQMAGNQLHRRIAGMPMFYFVDLPGIRPIPTNWPQNLILAMMEVLAKNRDRISGLGNGRFDTSAFLTPSGINLTSAPVFGNDPDFPTFQAWQAELTRLRALPPAQTSAGGPANAAAIKLLESLANASRESGMPFAQEVGGNNNRGPIAGIQIKGYPTRVDLRAAFGAANDAQLTMLEYLDTIAGVPGTTGAYDTLHQYLDNMVDQNLAPGSFLPVRPGPLPLRNYTMAVGNFLTALDDAYLNAISSQLVSSRPFVAQQESTSPSVYQIMLEAVELSMTKYNFNPSRDDIYFTVILLYYSLRNMGLDSEVTGFLARAGSIIETARRRSLTRFIADINTRFPVPPPGGLIDPATLNNYLALRFAYEAFSDPTSDAFRALTGVRVNPAPISGSNVKQIQASIKASLDAYEARLKQTGSGTNSAAIVDAIRKTVMPTLIKQMNNSPQSVFTYFDGNETPVEKIIESVDSLYNNCKTSVTEHIKNLSNLIAAVSSSSSSDQLMALTALEGSSTQLELFDKTATALDDFMKFLPKSVTKAERAYVLAMKRFMTQIGDDLRFTSETVGDLTKLVKDNAADIDSSTKYAYPIIATLIREAKEMQDVISAFDATVEPFEEFNNRSTDAYTRYPNYPKFDPKTKADPYTYAKKNLVKMYTGLLPTIEAITNASVFKDELNTKVSAKADIPIADPHTGVIDANPFDNFVRTSHSTPLYQALANSDGLTFGAKKRKDYVKMFETTPMLGNELLGFYTTVSDDIGVATMIDFQATVDTHMEKIVDSLYNKYSKRAKSQKRTKVLKAGVYQMAAGTGRGLKFTGEAIATGIGGGVGGTARSLKEGFDASMGIGVGSGKAIAGIASAAGGTVLGTGITLGGAAIGTGATLGGAAIAAGIGAGAATMATALTASGILLDASGAVLEAGGLAAYYGGKTLEGGIRSAGEGIGAGLQSAMDSISTGVLFGGQALGLAARGAGVAIAAGVGGGITLVGVGASAATQAVATSWTLYKTRKEIKKAALLQPEVLAAEEARVLALKRNKEAILIEKETDRRVAITRKEQVALQMEVNMLDLGAQRLRLLAIQAKAEEKAATSDAIARVTTAQSQQLEAELNAVEESLALQAEQYALQTEQEQRAHLVVMKELKAEERLKEKSASIADRELDAQAELRARISSSNLQQQTLQANYDELAGRLHRAKKNRGRFVSSIGSEARAKRENITPMKGELGQQFGNVTPAQYLLELDQSIIDMEKKLQGMGI